MSFVLERRYGRLLMAYPAEYRRARGAEMIGTLMESASPGQTWPSVAEAVDLLGGALRQRLGLSTVPGLAAGLTLAAPLALAFAGGIGGYYLVAEWAAGSSPALTRGYRGFGPLPTIGPIVYIAWLLAALGRAVLPRIASRWLIGIAVAATVAVVPVAPLVSLTRPTLPLLVPLLLFGLIALAGSDHAAARAERIGLAIGSAVTSGALVALTYWYMSDVVYIDSYGPQHYPGALVGAYTGGLNLGVVARLALVVIIGLVLVGGANLRRPSNDSRVLWAAALLLVPGLPMVAPLALGLGGSLHSANGLMPAGLAAGCVVLAGAVRLARRDQESTSVGLPGASAESALRLAGVLALGSAVAVSSYAWLAAALGAYGPGPGADQLSRLVWPLAALTSIVLPRWGTRATITLAIAVTIALPAHDDLYQYYGGPLAVIQGTLVVLGVVAFAGLPAGRPRPATGHLTGIALATVLGVLTCAVPAWWQLGFAGTLVYAPLASIVPCIGGLIAGWLALRGPLGRRWARGAAVLLASGGWLALTQPLYTSSWQRLAVLGVLLSVPVIAALRTSGRTSARTVPTTPPTPSRPA
jgi:hypothetical protein